MRTPKIVIGIAIMASALISRPGLAAAPGAVVSRDPVDGGATFVWSAGREQRARPGARPEEAARDYLARHAAHYGLEQGDLASVVLRRIHDPGRGAILAIFGQRVGGLDLEGVRVTVLMTRELDLVALGGSLVRAAAPRPPAGAASAFALAPEAALEAAFRDLFGRESAGSWRFEGESAGAQVFGLLPSAETRLEVALWGPARVWRVWFPMSGELVPAYKLEILATAADGDASYAYVVDARDGTPLKRTNLTVSDADPSAPAGDPPFNFRVWADSAGLKTPLDGPISDVTPHPTGLPDGTAPTFIAPSLISMLGFDQFFDPWLPPAATVSTGNNVDAYADLIAPDGFSAGDVRASTTAANTFDHLYDTAVSAGANPTQTQGAIVNLFYTTNWLHDFFYDSGFDEAAGNAQQDNYGRGGVGGDRMHAESDDYAETNNANMSTPADGASPRMQMFVWSGLDEAYVRRTLPDPDTDFAAQGATYGPADFDLTDDLVLVVDGTAPPNDGCQAPTVSIAGKIALVDRGTCTFVQKTQVAQAAGAVGIIVANNVSPGLPAMGGTDPGGITIGSLGISQADGTTLKNDLIAGAVQVRLFRDAGPIRSGSLDNMIVAHEWGHYFHHRLQSCGTTQCSAQSEGWGDFVALHTAVEAGDAYDGGVYGAAIYSTAAFGPDAAYFGIRRFPYSTDFTKNGLTFRHIADGEALPPTPIFPNGAPNSEVHNAGEIWASMLFEAYVALLTDPAPGLDGSPAGAARLTFDEARRRMADYAVAGLQATPNDATFTETRDGLLAAAYAGDPADFQAMAAAFATRGAGTCAKSPARDSTNFVGVIESFTLSGRMAVAGAAFADDVVSCDSDGYLDALETGTLEISVDSLGPLPLVGTEVAVASNNPHVTFPGGASAVLGTLGFGDTGVASFTVAAGGTPAPLSTVTVTVTVTDPDTCELEVVAAKVLRLAVDEGTGTTDGVEAQGTSWTLGGTPDTWSRVTSGTNTVWHGLDSGFITDTRLASAAILVNPAGDFVLDFDHRYQFEADTTFWDGGVIEYSTNGGASWSDLSTLVAVPYDGVITNTSGNPLGGRSAFSGQNPAYPAMDHLSLDVGTALAGQTVLLRFRIGTDEAVSAAGWDIDNVAVQNAGNQPFVILVPDSPSCNPNYLFADDFETGGTSLWSARVP